MAIEQARKIIDKAMPPGPDLVPEYDYAMRAPLYNLAHSGIENGLKALIRQVEGDHPSGHNLRTLFRRLKGKDAKRARILEDVFTDIVNFYTIDTSHWVHFQTLDTYFKEYGSEKLFETYRYWALEDKELNHIPIFVHRELLVVLGEWCQWGNRHRMSKRVQSILHKGFQEGLEKHLNREKRCEPCWKKTSALAQTEFHWFNDPSPTLFDTMRDAYSQNYNINEAECMDEIIYWAVQYLEESDDPAVRYCIGRRLDLPEGSVSLPCDIEIELESDGLVKIKNGQMLGRIVHSIDRRWYAQCIVSPYTGRLAKTKADAINWLANECTEIVKVSVNCGPHIPKRAMSRPQPLGPGWNESRIGFKITFTKEDHGLSIGQHLDVRSGRKYAAIHDGIIVKVRGREVVWGDT